MRACSLLTLALIIGLPLTATADAECTAASTDCVEVGKWKVSVGLGAGMRTNPVVNRKDIPLVVLPEISYTGERFFVHNLDMGAMLWETSSQQLNLLFTPSYDQVFFHRWNPGNFVVGQFTATSPPVTEPPFRTEDELTNAPPPDIPGEDDSPPPPVVGLKSAPTAGQVTAEAPALAQINQDQDLQLTYQLEDLSRLHKRRTAVLAGLEYRLTLEDWDLQAHWLQDVSGVHGGYEVRLALAKHYQWNRQSLAVAVGANWQSDAVIDYYYGIRRDEVTLDDSVYHGTAGLSGIASVDWRYAINPRWTLRLHASYRQLAKEIHQSPLVTDDQVITGFIGGVYHF